VDQTALDTDLHTFLAVFEDPALHGPANRMAITYAIVAAQFTRVVTGSYRPILLKN